MSHLPADIHRRLDDAAPSVEPVAHPGLSPKQEPKYTVSESAIVNRASGEAIPADEPVFIFRARDIHAREAIEAYACVLEPGAHRDAVVQRVADFAAFAAQHPARMKVPDTEPATPQAQPAAAPAVQAPLTAAARDVLAERQRQISVEGWTPEHDDQHKSGGMAVAAACYAAWSMPSRPASEVVSAMWPLAGWAWQWFKPKDTRSNLIRAAALLLAEIERLDRAHGITPQEGANG